MLRRYSYSFSHVYFNEL